MVTFLKKQNAIQFLFLFIYFLFFGWISGFLAADN